MMSCWEVTCHRISIDCHIWSCRICMQWHSVATSSWQPRDWVPALLLEEPATSKQCQAVAQRFHWDTTWERRGLTWLHTAIHEHQPRPLVEGLHVKAFAEGISLKVFLFYCTMAHRHQTKNLKHIFKGTKFLFLGSGVTCLVLGRTKWIISTCQNWIQWFTARH